MNNCTISIGATQQDAFASFVPSLLSSAKHTFLLQGALGAKLGSSVAAVAHSLGSLGLGGLGDGLVDATSAVIGSVAVSGVGFKTSITLDRCNGLRSGTFVKKISHTSDANGFSLISLVNIVNPSPQLTVNMDELTFDTLDGAGNFVGVSVNPSFTFVPGTNALVLVTISKTPDVLKGLMEKSDIWTLLGTPTSDISPFIAKSFANVGLSLVPVLAA